MPRKKRVVEPKVEEVKEVVETPIEIKTSFDVISSKGEFVRNYSVEIHGKEADKLAEMFANKIGGIIK